MLSLLAGCVLFLYLSINNKKTNCSNELLNLSVDGRIISLQYLEEIISVHSEKSGVHKLDIYDKCAQNKIKSLEVSSEK